MTEFEEDEIPTQTDLAPPPVMRTESERWRAEHDRRLARLEANVSLCVNYMRELAAERLGHDAVARIEASAGNGHG
jgi:hypothetical protein